MKKVSLYKFTYKPLLKNDGQLKQKSDKKKKKRSNILPNGERKKKERKQFEECAYGYFC